MPINRGVSRITLNLNEHVVLYIYRSYKFRGDLSWGSFYALAFRFCLRFESLYVHIDRKVNTNTNAWLTQTQKHTRRHYTTTVQNWFMNTMLTQHKRIKGASGFKACLDPLQLARLSRWLWQTQGFGVLEDVTVCVLYPAIAGRHDWLNLTPQGPLQEPPAAVCVWKDRSQEPLFVFCDYSRGGCGEKFLDLTIAKKNAMY